MSLITDGILIAASITACFYCFVLNIRLKALRSTKSGIGATISELSNSVGELEISLAKTKDANSLAAEKLEDLVGEAGTLADFLSDLLERAETAKDTLDTAPGSDKPEAITADKQASAPTEISLEFDADKTASDGQDEEKPGEAPEIDLKIELDTEKSDAEEAEPRDDTISIDLDYDKEETRKTGTG